MAKPKVCLECKEEYYTGPYDKGHGAKFCSKKCRLTYRKRAKSKQLCWDDIKREWVKLDD